MVPAPTYAKILTMLGEARPGEAFGGQLSIPEGNRVLGILFFSENLGHPQVQDIVSNIDSLNHRSGSHIQFLMAGLSRGDGSKLLFELDGNGIFFNTGDFWNLVDEMQARVAGWQFDFGVDLLLVDIEGQAPGRSLNYRDAIYFKLDELVKQGICVSASQALDRVIQLSRETALFSTRDITAKFQATSRGNWFKAMLLKMFPDSVGRLARIEAVLGGGRAIE